MKNQIEKNQTTEIVKTPDSVEGLITKAIENKVDVDTMKSLLEMRRELKREWAREQFFEAMSNLQSELPTIKKTKIVKNKDGSKRYSYAPLDQIIKQTKNLIKKHGFSYIFDTEIKDGMVIVSCRVTHKYGHTETSTFGVPIGQKIDSKFLTPEEYKRIMSSMNDQQRMGSALTYAKRYTFCDAFGILTSDEDDDALSASENQESGKEEKTEQRMITPAQKNLILRLIQEGKIAEKPGNLDKLTVEEANNLIKNSLKKQYEKPTDLG